MNPDILILILKFKNNNNLKHFTMKKTLLFFVFIAFFGYLSAQDTIAGWTFPTSIKTPSFGLAINSGRFIGTEDDVNRPVTFSTGIVSGDTAATAIGWNNGVMTKYWIVKFKTSGYRDIKISSKQRAGNQNGGGPKNFLIQWKMGTAAWSNLINDTIQVGNDWTSGVVTDAAFPSAADTSASNISVRWVVALDLNLNGGAVDSLATSKIDNIIVTGTSISSGFEEVLYESQSVNMYPNPSNGIIHLNSNKAIQQLSIYNQNGSLLYNSFDLKSTMSFDLSVYGSGIYLVKVIGEDGSIHNLKAILY